MQEPGNTGLLKGSGSWKAESLAAGPAESTASEPATDLSRDRAALCVRCGAWLRGGSSSMHRTPSLECSCRVFIQTCSTDIFLTEKGNFFFPVEWMNLVMTTLNRCCRLFSVFDGVFFSAFCTAALPAAWLRCWRVLVDTLSLSYSLFLLPHEAGHKSQQEGLKQHWQPQETELPFLKVDWTLWWAEVFHLFCVSLTGVWWGESCQAMAFKKLWCAVALGFLLPFSCAHTDFFTSIGEACFGVAKRVSWQPSKLILQQYVNHPRL